MVGFPLTHRDMAPQAGDVGRHGKLPGAVYGLATSQGPLIEAPVSRQSRPARLPRHLARLSRLPRRLARHPVYHVYPSSISAYGPATRAVVVAGLGYGLPLPPATLASLALVAVLVEPARAIVPGAGECRGGKLPPGTSTQRLGSAWLAWFGRARSGLAWVGSGWLGLGGRGLAWWVRVSRA